MRQTTRSSGLIFRGVSGASSQQVITRSTAQSRLCTTTYGSTRSFADVERTSYLQELVGLPTSHGSHEIRLCMSGNEVENHPSQIHTLGSPKGMLFSLHPVLSRRARFDRVLLGPTREMAHCASLTRPGVSFARSERRWLPDGGVIGSSSKGHRCAVQVGPIARARDFIPWDTTYDGHYRTNLKSRPRHWKTARSTWPAVDLVVVCMLARVEMATWLIIPLPEIETVSSKLAFRSAPACSMKLMRWVPQVEIGEFEVKPDRVLIIGGGSGGFGRSQCRLRPERTLLVCRRIVRPIRRMLRRGWAAIGEHELGYGS